MALHQVYSTKCQQIGLYFKEFLPADIAYLIAGICWSLRSEPVLLFLTCNKYRIVNQVFDAWKRIKEDIPKTYPELRVRQMKLGHIHLSTYMSSICDDCDRVPLVLLIPGTIWDQLVIQYSISDNVRTMPCDELDIKYKPSGIEHFNGTIWPNGDVTWPLSYSCIDFIKYTHSYVNTSSFIEAQNEVAHINKLFIKARDESAPISEFNFDAFWRATMV
jgi:hypothetical protein